MTFTLELFCRHEWGFPRRWFRFAGKPGVDVQTCVKCGARRLSTIQFGHYMSAMDKPAPAEVPYYEVSE